MSHESPNVTKDEWLTPKYIIDALGPFDLDPCASIERPWATAKKHYTYLDNGLMLPWEGRVWCNPPYGKHTIHWLGRCAEHKNCIALLPARTETKAWFEYVWPYAHSIFFFKGRLKFVDTKGDEDGTAGFPSVLVSYDKWNSQRIWLSKLKGKQIKL